uniref:UL16-binding protein 1 n=1 Tax=Ailuropoda melanoleuca TaxID=9646 RepID=G1MIW3_AILME
MQQEIPRGRCCPGMVRTGTSNFSLGLLRLFILPVWLAAGCRHVLCLFYTFSIISPARPGQPWYKIEGQINGSPFVYYDSQSKELKPVGRLGLQLKDIPFWERQKETLEDSCNELKTKPLKIRAETSSNRDFRTLQGRLTCERGANREHRSFWWFHLNEQITSDFKLENRKWTVDHSGDQRLKVMLDSDRELTEFLMRVSDGDCMSWLQQISEHLEEMRETTSATNHTARHGPGPGQGQGHRIQHLDPRPVPQLCSHNCHPHWSPLEGQAAEATKKPLSVGTSSATLPLDELLFIFRQPLLRLQIQRPQSDRMLQHVEPPTSLLAFHGSPVGHFPLAYHILRSLGPR